MATRRHFGAKIWRQKKATKKRQKWRQKIAPWRHFGTKKKLATKRQQKSDKKAPKRAPWRHFGAKKNKTKKFLAPKIWRHFVAKNLTPNFVAFFGAILSLFCCLFWRQILAPKWRRVAKKNGTKLAPVCRQNFLAPGAFASTKLEYR
jgi:hypothetical protein